MIEIPIEKKVLSENQRVAEELRTSLADSGTLSLNFIGSPGVCPGHDQDHRQVFDHAGLQV